VGMNEVGGGRGSAVVMKARQTSQHKQRKESKVRVFSVYATLIS
jgi:hypothetical protein